MNDEIRGGGGTPPMNESEQLPDLDVSRLPAGCRLDLHAGMGHRLCAESYDDVMTKLREADLRDLLEFRVLAGAGPEKAEVVRQSFERQLIGAVLEITSDLEERWKEAEREAQEQAAMAPAISIPGLGGFRLG